MSRRALQRSRSSRPVWQGLTCAAGLAWLVAGCGMAANRGTAAIGDAAFSTISLPGSGTDVALSPDGTRAWLPATARVQIVDLTSRQVSGAIETGDQPYAIAVAADGQIGVTVDLLQREAWVLDLPRGGVARRAAFGRNLPPVLRPDVALSPDGATAWATISVHEGAGADLLRRIDTASGSVDDRALDFHPGSLALAPGGGVLWIAGCRGLCSTGAVWAVDAASGRTIAEIPVASSPSGLALSPDGARVFVANGEAASLSVVDTAQRRVIATVAVGSQPLGVATSPDGRRVYVTNFAAGTLTAIDAASLVPVATARVGTTPRALVISPDGSRAFITSSEPVLRIVDLGALTATR